MWTVNFQLQASWLLWSTHALLTLLTFFTIFRWDISGYGTRYWLNILFAGAITLSVIKVKDLQFFKKGCLKWSWGLVIEVIIFIAILIWGFAGMGVKENAVEIQPPLQGDSNYVIHGGSTSILNYHGAFSEQQRYALDVNELNDRGFRAGGILPKKLDEYAVFGDTIYSPFDATIVHAVDSIADQTPPQTLPGQPLGNHIWLKKGNLYVVLAHLKKKSLKIETGMFVKANQPIANVGNSGNTTEPHLHIHAVKIDFRENPDPDALLYRGEPVPLKLKSNGFLTRNDIF